MRIYDTRKLLAEGILPRPAPTHDVEALRRRLEALRLGFIAEALPNLLADAVKQRPSSSELVRCPTTWRSHHPGPTRDRRVKRIRGAFTSPW